MGFWALAAPALIGAGSSLLSGFLNKPSGAERALGQSVAAKNRAEQQILEQRQRMIEELWGRTSNFSRDIVGEDGKRLIFHLPGVGGKEGLDTEAQLTALMNAIDFGDKREFEAMMGVLGQATSGNSAGAGESARQSMSRDRQAGTEGIASLIEELASAGVAAYQGREGSPETALSQIPPSPTQGTGVPFDAGKLLEDMGLGPTPGTGVNL
jgi:hypothetical protein